LDFVTERIAIGNRHDAANMDILMANGITAVLNVACNLDISYFEDDAPASRFTVEYQKVGMIDGPGNKATTLAAAVYMLTQLLGRHDKVFVHCRAGASRAPTIVSTYLAYVQGMSFDEALEFVRLKHTVAKPNQHLRELARAVLTEIVEAESESVPVISSGSYQVENQLKQLRINITQPMPMQRVPWRFPVKGKVSKEVVELVDKIQKNLAPDEKLAIGVYVWDPMDAHGPWRQSPAPIQKDCSWEQSEVDQIIKDVCRRPSFFGKEDSERIIFKVKVQLERFKEEMNVTADKIIATWIEEVEPVTISVVRE